MAAERPLLRHVIALDAAISLFRHKLFHPLLPTASSSSSRSPPTSDSHSLSPSPCFSPLFPRPSSLSSPISSSASSSISPLSASPNQSSAAPVRPTTIPLCPPWSQSTNSFPSRHSTRVFFVASLISLSAAVIQAALIELKARGGLVDRWMFGERVVENVVIGVFAWVGITASSRVSSGGISSSMLWLGLVWELMKVTLLFDSCGLRIS
ncbi:hypothetical protein LINGRAPRIM_LOCUS677 [Linum grandiflorum]